VLKPLVKCRRDISHGQAGRGCRLRVSDPSQMWLHWLGTLNRAMPRASVTFRPSQAAAEWLDRQRQERRIPLTTLCQMALDEHMHRHEARVKAEAKLAAREARLCCAPRLTSTAQSVEPEATR
jgi:hypothetical protein